MTSVSKRGSGERRDDDVTAPVRLHDLVGFMLKMYVLLDGFNLGAGAIAPFAALALLPSVRVSTKQETLTTS